MEIEIGMGNHDAYTINDRWRKWININELILLIFMLLCFFLFPFPNICALKTSIKRDDDEYKRHVKVQKA